MRNWLFLWLLLARCSAGDQRWTCVRIERVYGLRGTSALALDPVALAALRADATRAGNTAHDWSTWPFASSSVVVLTAANDTIGASASARAVFTYHGARILHTELPFATGPCTDEALEGRCGCMLPADAGVEGTRAAQFGASAAQTASTAEYAFWFTDSLALFVLVLCLPAAVAATCALAAFCSARLPHDMGKAADPASAVDQEAVPVPAAEPSTPLATLVEQDGDSAAAAAVAPQPQPRPGLSAGDGDGGSAGVSSDELREAELARATASESSDPRRLIHGESGSETNDGASPAGTGQSGSSGSEGGADRAGSAEDGGSSTLAQSGLAQSGPSDRFGSYGRAGGQRPGSGDAAAATAAGTAGDREGPSGARQQQPPVPPLLFSPPPSSAAARGGRSRPPDAAGPGPGPGPGPAARRPPVASSFASSTDGELASVAIAAAKLTLGQPHYTDAREDGAALPRGARPRFLPRDSLASEPPNASDRQSVRDADDEDSGLQPPPVPPPPPPSLENSPRYILSSTGQTQRLGERLRSAELSRSSSNLARARRAAPNRLGTVRERVRALAAAERVSAMFAAGGADSLPVSARRSTRIVQGDGEPGQWSVRDQAGGGGASFGGSSSGSGGAFGARPGRYSYAELGHEDAYVRSPGRAVQRSVYRIGSSPAQWPGTTEGRWQIASVGAVANSAPTASGRARLFLVPIVPPVRLPELSASPNRRAASDARTPLRSSEGPPLYV